MDDRGGTPLMDNPAHRRRHEDDTGPLPAVANPLAPWQEPMTYRPTVPRPASFGIRVVARLVDVAVVALLVAVGYAVVFGVAYAVGGTSVSGVLHALLVWALVPSVAWLVYRVLGEGNATGQTVGKAVCGIRVLRVDRPSDSRPGLGRAVLRALVSVLNAFLFVADLVMLVSADRRTVGDKASGTAVVHTNRRSPSASMTSAVVAGVVVCALAVPVAVLGHGLSGTTGEQAGGALGTVVVQPDGRGFDSGFDDQEDPAVGKSGGGAGIGGAGIGGGEGIGGNGSLGRDTDAGIPAYDGDLASTVVAVRVPDQAANGVDGGGNTMTYHGENMLDSDPGTCWRMDGDGTGLSLTFDLGTTRQITSVGMVNGYAKTDPYTGDDRYVQERQITDVTWSFDDGSSYTQSMDPTYADMQSISLPAPASSQTVTVYLDSVNQPGDSDFDYTAISDISIQGD